MAQITKPRQIFTYNGPGIVLANAPFLEYLDRVYRYNDTGSALIGFKRGSVYNNLLVLENGEPYIVLSATVPYEIPTAEGIVMPEEDVFPDEYFDNIQAPS